MTDQVVVRRLKEHGFVFPEDFEPHGDERADAEPQRDRWAILAKFPTLNSVLLPIVFTLIGGLITAGYVWIRYDQNYFFGEYQEQAVAREISDTYVEFGNSMMLLPNGYKAAAVNYQRALELNPNNQDAVIGLMKAQVMIPEEGDQFLSDEVVLAKIDYLLALESKEGRNRAELYFMKGSALATLGNSTQAERAYLYGIATDVSHPGNHMGLALLYARTDTARAPSYALRAVELTEASDGPELAAPYLIAGITYLQTGQWEQAREQYQKARTKTFSLSALYGLELATRYSGAFDEAMEIGEQAITRGRLYDPELLATDPASLQLWEVFLIPQYPGDTASIQQSEWVNGAQAKLALHYYAYGIDAALAGQLEIATQVFDIATRIDTQGQLRSIVVNQLISAQNFLDPADEVDQWIQSQLTALQV
ncbi:MAG TPA: hypothetical protein VKZ96_18135 [Thermomicrobiales bacterium]|nr:hypothetical protein [Thermomicrobiales bacterium]